jgi:hypothetical protein
MSTHSLLIHFGNTMRLLEILKTDRPLEKENQVYLDFYPNFHNGPPEEAGNKYVTGRYGVTWDNWNGNSTLAIWSLVQCIIPQARSQNIDFEYPHTAFRKWLEDGPCWRVATTLPALLDPTTPLATLCAMVDAANPTHHGSVRKFKGYIGNRHGGWEWATVKYPCHACEQKIQGIFFGYAEYRDFSIDQTTHMTCWGCKLTHVLDSKTDHYKSQKREVLRKLLFVPDQDGLNTTDLKAFISNMETPEAYNGHFLSRNLARDIQRKRELVRQKFGNERELQERQRKIKESEKNMYGMVNCTGLVTDKLSDPWVCGWEWDVQTYDRGHQVPVHR